MERQYTRLDEARNLIDPLIKGITDEEDKRGAYVHLYGTGLCASILALKRGYDRKMAEMAEVCGMLHDLLTYVHPEEDGENHAPGCAEYAKKYVLDKLIQFTDEEKEMMYQAVYNHSDKHVKGSVLDEIIKDADCAHHALRNPMEDYFWDRERIQQVVQEMIN